MRVAIKSSHFTRTASSGNQPTRSSHYQVVSSPSSSIVVVFLLLEASLLPLPSPSLHISKRFFRLFWDTVRSLVGLGSYRWKHGTCNLHIKSRSFEWYGRMRSSIFGLTIEPNHRHSNLLTSSIICCVGRLAVLCCLSIRERSSREATRSQT